MSIELMLYQQARPKTLDEYVFVDENMKKKITEWVERKSFDHCIFAGPPGTGKSSLSLLLCDLCGVDRSDVLMINASIDTGVDFIRERISPFVETVSISSDFRVVILDEGDALSKNAQNSLKNMMEDTMQNARFIITTNNPHKIDDALMSRCKKYNIEKLDKSSYTLRVANVLIEKGIQFDVDSITHYVEKNYPDMRGIFNDIESFTFDNELKIVDAAFQTEKPEWMLESINKFIDGKHREGRDIVCNNISYDEYEQFYRIMYENLEWWCGNNNDKMDQALIIIKDSIVADSSVGDREIVLSACITQLSML